MQTYFEKLQEQKFLIIILILLVTVNVVANFIGENVAILVGNFMYIPVAVSLVVVSTMKMFQSGFTGKHGMAWIALTVCAVSWLIAELTWIFYEVILNIDPFPSFADIFYLLGYPFLFMFLIFYIEPVQKAITKKMIAVATLLSLSILIPSLFIALQDNSNMSYFEAILAGAYPVVDALIIIPALIGIALFFKGQVNFMWTLVCIGIFSLFVADTVFLFAQLDMWYYTGHPIEVLFYFMYVLISYGVYDNMKVFSRA
ncbi:MAG TPA: hypothetical protein VLD64_04350 [Nitrosarchaeum sp.]|nr:hypothetical protein [Nitrosarchaeum sp.]